MSTDAPAAPPGSPVSPPVFDRLRATLAAGGPLAAVDALCDELRAAGDYHALFYALLMRARVELGVPPFPTGPAADLPPAAHEAYEEAIRRAAREVGGTYLEKKDIPRAWGFFRLIGEPGPVKAALAVYTPGPEDDTYPVVDVAWHQQVHPEKGFDLVLDRHGVCSAITLVGSADLTNYPDLRAYCVRKLIGALHAQLSDRLRVDLAARGIDVPDGATVPQMIAGRGGRAAPGDTEGGSPPAVDLFADDAYHVDVSHLSSVVQMSLQLPPGSGLGLARELCEYGRRLAGPFRGDGDPPFEQSYADYLVYLRILDGIDVDAGLIHFRDKIAPAADEGNSFPAEVYVNLLAKLGRLSEALATARRYLADVPEENLTCPGVTELARRVGDFTALTETARAKGDTVNYLAGLIAGGVRPAT